ncbi:MAG: hypothetical protein GTO18_14720 [Anaerolineales bacterium]|nr:hypothetical protein [Anaerolineales bacterium]
MSDSKQLLIDQYYHIYNRGNNNELLFREARNYNYFLKLSVKYAYPIIKTYAYCLLPNHFHFLVKIKDCQSYPTSRAFANLFSTYAKAINKAYDRSGSLFEKVFHRKMINDDRYFTSLVVYIDRNLQKHGFVDDFRNWPHSSYRTILSNRPSRIERTAVLEWFGGPRGFEEVHTTEFDESQIEQFISDGVAQTRPTTKAIAITWGGIPLPQLTQL